MVIIKAGKYVRFGFTYDTPTWYQVSEESLQSIQTVSEDADGVFTTNVDPRIVNIFEDYTLQTPGRYAASVAFLFGKVGLLSLDYAYTDYNNIRFRPSGDPRNQELFSTGLTSPANIQSDISTVTASVSFILN